MQRGFHVGCTPIPWIRNPGFFTKTRGRKPIRPVFASIQDELNRQRDKIELIASENIVSKAVLEAQGSVLTNKYAEGYPGKRYYGGCEYVDVSRTTRDRPRLPAVRRQLSPTSSPIPAPMPTRRVFLPLLQPGDTFMGLDLAAGGHLTHGHPANYLRQMVQARALHGAQG